MNTNADISESHWFTNRQVVSVIIAVAIATFYVTMVYFRFVAMESEIQTAKTTYDTELRTLKAEYDLKLKTLEEKHDTEMGAHDVTVQTELKAMRARTEYVNDRLSRKLGGDTK